MRVPRTLTVLHKELAVTAIAGLAVLGIATTSIELEPLYTGFMAVELSAMLRLRAQAPDRVYPAIAALRPSEASGQSHIEAVLLPTADPADYALGAIQIRCGAEAPAPVASSRHRFAQGIRERCALTLPPIVLDALAKSAGSLGSIEFHPHRWAPDAALNAGLNADVLIQCRDLLPLRLARDSASVDAWAKANCTFVPTWKP